MNLSKNFTYNELIYSPTASRRGISNNPDNLEEKCLRDLATMILQPIRDRFGVVKITSGFRSSELNKALRGSSPTSQHMKGQAADFHCKNANLKKVFNWIAFESGLPFDQIIYEKKRFSKWIHISYGSNISNRRQIMRAYVYRSGTRYQYVNKKI